MQIIKDFLSKLNIRNLPLVGTLYATLDDLFDSRRGVLAVSGLIITIALAITPAAHEVFVPSVMITAVIVLVTVFGYSYTDAKAIVKDELTKGDLQKWISEIIDTVMENSRESAPTMSPEEAADAVYGSPEAVR